LLVFLCGRGIIGRCLVTSSSVNACLSSSLGSRSKCGVKAPRKFAKPATLLKLPDVSLIRYELIVKPACSGVGAVLPVVRTIRWINVVHKVPIPARLPGHLLAEVGNLRVSERHHQDRRSTRPQTAAEAAKGGGFVRHPLQTECSTVRGLRSSPSGRSVRRADSSAPGLKHRNFAKETPKSGSCRLYVASS
jgi:hypothetical protein